MRGGSRVQVGAGDGKQKECDAHMQLEPPLLHWQQAWTVTREPGFTHDVLETRNFTTCPTGSA